jgi:hypothetical protein
MNNEKLKKIEFGDGSELMLARVYDTC